MAGITRVFAYPVLPKSKYVPLTFRGIESTYQPVLSGLQGIELMLAALAAGERAVLHIQWEEFIFRKCRSEEDAARCVASFRCTIEQILGLDGTIVLTIHNGMPHAMTYRDAFIHARQIAADAAKLILVHNQASANYIVNQIKVNPAKLRFLPHPSYLESYEAEGTALADIENPPEPAILLFGSARAQKGFDDVIETLTSEFLTRCKARLLVNAHGPYGDIIKGQYSDRTDIQWSLDYTEDSEAAALLRRSTCTVLAYKSFLTSGIAHLVLSAGGMMVAPDVSQHRDLLPDINQRFLYRQNDAEDMRRAIREVFALSASDRKACAMANLAVARTIRPEIIAQKLAGFYEEAGKL